MKSFYKAFKSIRSKNVRVSIREAVMEKCEINYDKFYNYLEGYSAISLDHATYITDIFAQHNIYDVWE